MTEWLASLVGSEPFRPRARPGGTELVEPALHDFEQAFGPVLDGSVIAKMPGNPEPSGRHA